MHIRIWRNFLPPTGQREDCISDTDPPSTVGEFRLRIPSRVRDLLSSIPRHWPEKGPPEIFIADSEGIRAQTDSGDSILTARDC